jgi:trimeric autotransporter adhesin
MKKILLFISLVCMSPMASAQLVLNNSATAAQLVSNLLGPGVTATNITYTGAAGAKATFTCSGSCSLGFPGGIMLSTGSASGATAPASVFQNTNNNTAGDAQLNSIVAPQLTQDAAILEFDFTVASDSVKFEYIFGSEEYNDFVNTPFNDVFAFYISGPGIVGSQNMALIPGTATAVSINNVNNGGPYAGVSSGPCTNCAYYVDNVGGANFFLDGHTTTLVAKAKVQPCQLYHMKIAIADVSDGAYDSDVFLKQGSFSALGPITVYANGTPIPNGGLYYACAGTNVNLCLSQAPTYNWSTGDVTQCITVNQQNLTPNGIYEAIFVGPNCFGFSQVQVIFVTPTATITPSGPVDLCPGGNVTLTANAGNSYLWSNGATSQSINVSAAGTYTVTVTVGAGCSATSTPVTVTVGSATAQINGVLSLCNGANTTLTANAAQSYLWNTGATSQAINVTAAGTYTVTVTQAGGCTATTSANVTVNPNPVPSITGNLSICQGTNTNLDAGAGFATYLWNTGASTQTITPSTSGTYTVTVTNASGCSASTTASLVVNPLPTPNITGTTSFCSGNNSNLNAGAGYAGYAWSTGASTQIISVSTSGTYTVTVTDPNGCSASTNVAVVVNPLPVPAITGTFAFCQGSNTSLNATPGFAGYSWSTGANTASINVNTANTFTVTVTDANGCTGSISQSTTVNPNPTPSITGTNSICQGTNTSFNAGPGYSSYLWSTGAGTQSVTLNTSGTYTVTVSDANGCTGTTSAVLTVNPLPTPSITGTTTFCSGQNNDLNAGAGYAGYLWNTGATSQLLNVSTSGTYTVTVTNAFGCTASTNTLVTVNPLPTPNITGPAAICSGSNATLDAGAGYSGYLWNTGASTQTINTVAGGTYTVTVTSGAGCSASTSTSLIVNPLPTPAITGVTTICQGNTTTLDAGAGYSGYLWSNGATTQTITTGAAGTLTVTVTDANGCSAPASSTVTVNALPTPAITGVNAFCDGQQSTLDAGPGYASYLWNTGAVTRTIVVTTAGTYTVTVTAATGCSASDNELVTVHPNPTPVISGTLSFCQGTSTTLDAGPGYSSYLWNNGSSTQTLPVSSGGNYTVTVTSAFGCSGTTSAVTTVNPLPQPVITGVTAVCQGTSSTFDAGAGYNNYLWSNGSTSQTINPNVAGSYTVTVTDANGCTNNTSLSLTVNANPVPSITGTNEFCDGDNSNINAGAGYVNYAWSTGASTQVINVNSAGTYSVTVTDANGCIGSTSLAITVHPNPVPVINGGTGICQGSSTQLTVPGSYATYQWNTGASTNNITVSTAGNYAVTVTSAFGCVGTTSTTMVINPLPTPTITGITAICQGTTSTFDAGAGYSAYLWSNGSTTQTINPGVAGNYTVTVTDINGCQNSTALALVVNPLPTPSITGNFAFCQGDNSDINAGAGYVSYQWNNGATSQIINVSNMGTYTVTVTDNNGCSSSTSTFITVHTLPVPVISGLNAICDGTTTTFNTGNYSSYLWSDGSSGATLTTGIAGTYSVVVTDVNGCTGSASQTLTVYDLPSATISGNNTICFGENTPLQFTFVGTAPFTYTYTNGLVTSPPQTANSNSATIPISPGNTVTYTIATISDANCPGSASGSAAITVNQLPQPLITGDLSICDGETTTLTATPGFVTYTWSNSSNTPVINTGIGGIYTVTVEDQNGCLGTSPAANLVVNMVPVVAFTNDTTLTCSVPKVNFTNLSVYDPFSVFEWTFGDGGTSNAPNPSHLYFNPGTYPVSLTITTPAGCTNSTSQNVSVVFFPLPVADFVTSPPSTNVFNGKVGFVDRSSHAVSWMWDFGDGARSHEQNPSHYYNEVGDYLVTLYITNIAGCEDVHQEIININPYYIPNAFTPNGDGVNDMFFYSGYQLDVSSYNMKIFNRWGQLVFTGAGENDNWNGMSDDGQPAPAGTYVYRLIVKTRGGKEHVFNGQVNLVR